MQSEQEKRVSRHLAQWMWDKQKEKALPALMRKGDGSRVRCHILPADTIRVTARIITPDEQQKAAPSPAGSPAARVLTFKLRIEDMPDLGYRFYWVNCIEANCQVENERLSLLEVSDG